MITVSGPAAAHSAVPWPQQLIMAAVLARVGPPRVIWAGDVRPAGLVAARGTARVAGHPCTAVGDHVPRSTATVDDHHFGPRSRSRCGSASRIDDQEGGGRVGPASTGICIAWVGPSWVIWAGGPRARGRARDGSLPAADRCTAVGTSRGGTATLHDHLLGHAAGLRTVPWPQLLITGWRLRGAGPPRGVGRVQPRVGRFGVTGRSIFHDHVFGPCSRLLCGSVAPIADHVRGAPVGGAAPGDLGGPAARWWLGLPGS
jgi:hypothetical protein